MDTRNVEMTSEVRERLKDFIGFQIDATFRYVPKVWRESGLPKETWPVFTLKSKNGVEIAEAEDNAGFVSLGKAENDESKLHMLTGSQRLETLSKGIVSFVNFPMEDGSTINYDSKTNILTTVSVDGSEKSKTTNILNVIKHLRPKMQKELQEAINERSTLTEEELMGLG